ncbi:MAG: NAD(P)-binding domain-containing protein, partial [Chloroflexota bacterium]
MAPHGRPRRAVIGAGTWGTTLALLLSRTGPVTLLARDEEHAARLTADAENKRYLPGIALDQRISITSDAASLATADEIVVMAVPSRAMRATVASAAAHLHDDAVLLSVAKGIEADSLLRMSEVIASEVPGSAGRVAALSGPNLAPEIARGLPA